MKDIEGHGEMLMEQSVKNMDDIEVIFKEIKVIVEEKE
jgi:hypothetical protein